MLHTKRTHHRLYRIPQAQEYLGGVVSIKTLRDWVWRGAIDSVRLGRVVCIPEDALERLIAEGTRPARAARD
jgi:excisionase family DNA binding protein